MLSEKAINEYKELYKKKFGKEISNQEALEQATNLMRLIEIVYKPMTEKEHGMLQKRREETK